MRVFLTHDPEDRDAPYGSALPLLAEVATVVQNPLDAQAASSVEQVAAMVAGNVPPRSLNAEHATRLRDLWARTRH